MYVDEQLECTGTCYIVNSATNNCAASNGWSHASSSYCVSSLNNNEAQCCWPTSQGSSCSCGGVPVQAPVTAPTAVAPTTLTTKGFDLSTLLTASAASCLRSSGYSYVVPRGYRSTGEVDQNVCSSLINAYSGGIKVRDAYFFPQPTSNKSADTQMSEFVTFVSANCKAQWSGRLWLDIEGTQYWLSSTSANQKFYKSLVDACKSQVGNCGIYCSQSQWSALFGSSYVYGNDLPVWYAHYDGVASFSDWPTHTFGGWTTPYAKQYAGGTVCNTSTDWNYSPNFAA